MKKCKEKLLEKALRLACLDLLGANLPRVNRLKDVNLRYYMNYYKREAGKDV